MHNNNVINYIAVYAIDNGTWLNLFPIPNSGMSFWR